MTPRTRVVLICILAVVAFDALASIVSRGTGMPYGWATYGSWILYIALGYLAGRTSPRSALKFSALAGMIFGFADATLGWATSWLLGPGRIAGGVSVIQWIFVAVIVTALATGFAALGGSFARMKRGSKLP
jgi:hypothetical protein